MVFDPTAAPRDHDPFRKWYKEQCEWPESHGYNDPNRPAPALREWFQAIIETFPPMNGPLASDDLESSRRTDYSLGRSVIYAAFAWSQAEAAYKLVKDLARRHGVGFFDVSGTEGDLWWPVPGWKLICEARGEIPLPLDLTFAEVLDNLNPRKNSFYILEHDNGNYIQCGGSTTACTVECRVYQTSTEYEHRVLGHVDGSDEPTRIKMSGGTVTVRKGEVLSAADAAELFELFLAGKKFPKKYTQRLRDL